MTEITIYTLPNCPQCEQLKIKMKEKGIEYGELDMSSPEGRTELMVNSVFSNTAPVLQIGDMFYEHNEIPEYLSE